MCAYVRVGGWPQRHVPEVCICAATVRLCANIQLLFAPWGFSDLNSYHFPSVTKRSACKCQCTAVAYSDFMDGGI